MDSGFWTAVSGTEARDQQLQVIANNMANVDTVGFKKDGVEFQTFVKNRDAPDPVNTVPQDLMTMKQQYPLDGKENTSNITHKTFTEQSQGSLKKTDDPLDLAINGRGFFEVLTPSGVRYTRAGNFQVTSDGFIATSDGNLLLKREAENQGNNGAFNFETVKASRAIPAKGNIAFGKDGAIQINGAIQGFVSLIEPQVGSEIRKIGNSLYEVRGLTKPAPSEVHQGYLENSNVNAVKELSDLIQVNRNFDANQKVIRTYDSIDGRAVNELSKI